MAGHLLRPPLFGRKNWRGRRERRDGAARFLLGPLHRALGNGHLFGAALAGLARAFFRRFLKFDHISRSRPGRRFQGSGAFGLPRDRPRPRRSRSARRHALVSVRGEGSGLQDQACSVGGWWGREYFVGSDISVVATCVSALCFVFLFVLMRFRGFIAGGHTGPPLRETQTISVGFDLPWLSFLKVDRIRTGTGACPYGLLKQRAPSFRRMPESGIKVERSASGVSGSRMKTFRDDEQRRADT